jgi:hypothetical protein
LKVINKIIPNEEECCSFFQISADKNQLIASFNFINFLMRIVIKNSLSFVQDLIFDLCTNNYVMFQNNLFYSQKIRKQILGEIFVFLNQDKIFSKAENANKFIIFSQLHCYLLNLTNVANESVLQEECSSETGLAR